MKHLTTTIILGIIVAGSLASLAAIKRESPSQIPDLEGKVVIIHQVSTQSDVAPTENVTLGVVGSRQFMVVPLKPDEGSSHDLWVPLENVRTLRVFDNMEDAVKYKNRQSDNIRASRGRDVRTIDVTGLVTLDGMPLADAMVVFTPTAGGTPASGKTDDTGRFELANGALLGEYVVDIDHDKVPARYKQKGELKASVRDGKNEFTFDLSTGR